MTDYTDLVHILRQLNLKYGDMAADAIEAQAKRIAELEDTYEQVKEELTASYLCGYERAKSELSGRIDELEAALKPFADYWEPNAETNKTDVSITYGDLFNARKVLGEKE